MPKLFDLFGSRFDWRFRPGYSVVKNRSESEQKTARDSAAPESNQRKTSDQDESDYKRISKTDKKQKCPTEPFYETLRLLDEIL